VADRADGRLPAATLLRAWGCRPDEAGDDDEATGLLRKATRAGDPYRVVLRDVPAVGAATVSGGSVLPGTPEYGETPLILMTPLGRLDSAAAPDAQRLAKPLRRDRLRDALSFALGLTTGVPVAPSTASGARRNASGVGRRRSRILLVEDNSTNQIVALRLLDKFGYKADAVANGLEAVTSLRGIAYDLVLMDCEMPEMDGFEATRSIRRGDAGAARVATPIVAMTARAMRGDRERCLDAGMNDYISKPVDPTALAAALDRWLVEPADTPNDDDDDDDRRPEQALSPTAAGAAVIDRQSLVNRVMGDEALADTVLAMFLEDMPEQVCVMRSLVDSEDVEQARRQAHRIKGAAATVGCEALREVALAMEEAGAAGNAQTLTELMPRLESQFVLVQQAMAALTILNP
jgi:CheY-like chemotaxis protein/HPt (histidine-containing phosphotransfer) domain-containing protein